MQVHDSVRAYGRYVPAAIRRRLRRRPGRPAGQGAARRPRDPRRDAGPPARPRRAAVATSARSRSSCSTRPTGCSTWASCPTSGRSWPCCRPPAEPAVLGDVPGGDPQAVRRRCCATRRPSRSRRGTRRSSPSRQLIYPVDRDRKRALLSHLIRTHDGTRCSCSRGRRSRRSRLASRLVRDGIDAVAIHSDRTQGERTRALEDFKRRVRVLVATDVAARGLDIEDLPYVVNYELPRYPRRTSTASAAPAAPGRPARRSRWCASTRSTCCAASSGCSAGRSPGRSRKASSPIGTPSPGRWVHGWGTLGHRSTAALTASRSGDPRAPRRAGEADPGQRLAPTPPIGLRRRQRAGKRNRASAPPGVLDGVAVHERVIAPGELQTGPVAEQDPDVPEQDEFP